jgi:hypothetical protein
MQQNCDQSRAAPAFSPVWPGPSGPFLEWACALLLAPCAVASCPPALLLLSLRGALASQGALAGARTATCSQIGDGTSCMFDGVQHRTGGESNSVSAPGRTDRKTHCKEKGVVRRFLRVGLGCSATGSAAVGFFKASPRCGRRYLCMGGNIA